MEVRVIFPPGPGPGRAWTWEAPGPSVAEALQQTWREFNLIERGDPHEARQARSMMVGDVLDVAGETWVVEGVGFTPMAPHEAVAWVLLDVAHRCLGPGYARAQGWL